MARTYVGLDVSVKETAVCVVDDTGKVVCEHKATIQRSQFRANPTRFNPSETPHNRNEKLFFFIFNNLGIGKTTDQACRQVASAQW